MRKSPCEVPQSCPTFWDPVNCSLPSSSVHGILQARKLERVAISFSRGCSQPRDQIQVSCIAVSLFTDWATREALMVISLSKLRQIVKEREAWHAEVHGVTKNQTRLSDWTTTATTWIYFKFFEEPPYCFPQWLHHSHQQCIRVPIFSTLSPNTIILWGFLIVAILTGVMLEG